MVTIKVKENSKQAKAFLEFAKTFSFVEFVDPNLSESAMTKKEIAFYTKFKQATTEAKEIVSGKRKGKSLKDALDEI